MLVKWIICIVYSKKRVWALRSREVNLLLLNIYNNISTYHIHIYILYICRYLLIFMKGRRGYIINDINIIIYHYYIRYIYSLLPNEYRVRVSLDAHYFTYSTSVCNPLCVIIILLYYIYYNKHYIVTLYIYIPI